jgi:hypothetical protein
MIIRRISDEDLDEATDGWSGEEVFVFRWHANPVVIFAGADDPSDELPNGDDASGNWTVEVGAMEFLRGGSEGDVRREIDAALTRVAGVDEVYEEDRERWGVVGKPSGEEIARAVESALEPFRDAIQQARG